MNITNIERRVEQGVRTMISRKVGDLTCRFAKNYMFRGADNVRKFGISMFSVHDSVRDSLRDYVWQQYESR
jgi:hypothetical protein